MSSLVIVGAGAVFMQNVLAVHDTGAFELDGNAATGATDDWYDVFNTTSSASATSFTAEPDRQSTIFTGGGSKDGIDIDQWAWKDGAGGLPDKDNLLDSFAARYSLREELMRPGPLLFHSSSGTADVADPRPR